MRTYSQYSVELYTLYTKKHYYLHIIIYLSEKKYQFLQASNDYGIIYNLFYIYK